MTWLIFGAGAQGRLTLELLRARGGDDEVLLVDDDPSRHGELVDGVTVVGREELGAPGSADDALAVVAVGDNRARLRIAAELAEAGARFGTLVHPSAVVASSATVDGGSVVFAGAVVQSRAQIGAHVIVNSGAIVEHDCTIEDGASLSPGCCMGGRVHVGAGAFVGVGATLCPRVVVGAGAIVGAGAVVTADVPPDSLVYGVPARVVRAVDPERDWERLL